MKASAQRDVVAELDRLKKQHPDAHCELDHESPFELLVSTVLSAQTTDVAVNKTTPLLFKRWPDARALAKADPAEVEKVIGSLGFFRQKTKAIIGLSQGIVERHGGEVPRTMAELVKLPGVGRKTANVVLGVAFHAPEGVVVDTHVLRVSQRLRWSRHDTPEEVEADLMKRFPRSEWDILSHTLIFHGRRVCAARKPACAACLVNDVCPCAFKAENVGRKPPRARAEAPAKKKPGVVAKLSKKISKKIAKKVAKKVAKKPAKKRTAR